MVLDYKNGHVLLASYLPHRYVRDSCPRTVGIAKNITPDHGNIVTSQGRRTSNITQATHGLQWGTE